jgi:hypothetical protein
MNARRLLNRLVRWVVVAFHVDQRTALLACGYWTVISPVVITPPSRDEI